MPSRKTWMLILGVSLMVAALVVNPFVPLLSTALIPAVPVEVPQGSPVPLPGSSGVGWRVLFKDTGLTINSLDFFFPSDSVGMAKIVVGGANPPNQPVYTYDVTLPNAHVDLPSIEIHSDAISFNIASFSDTQIIGEARAPDPANEFYSAIFQIGPIPVAMRVSGLKSAVVPPPIAQFSYEVNGMSVSVQDESQRATAWNWSWGDGTFTTGTEAGEMLTHTYATNGTYTIVLNVRNDVGEHDSAQVDVTLQTPQAGKTVPEPITEDIRLPVFIALLVAGIVMLALAFRKRG